MHLRILSVLDENVVTVGPRLIAGSYDSLALLVNTLVRDNL